MLAIGAVVLALLGWYVLDRKAAVAKVASVQGMGAKPPAPTNSAAAAIAAAPGILTALGSLFGGGGNSANLGPLNGPGF